MKYLHKKESKVLIKFQNVNLVVVEDERFEFTMSTKDVAAGYGVDERVLRDHKRLQADELIEGKHWIAQKINTFSSDEKIDARRSNLKSKQTLWTKRGIVRLGFFIKSERAKQFRDWAEDFIVFTGENTGLNFYSINRENIELRRAINRMTENERELKFQNYINSAHLHDLKDLVAGVSKAAYFADEASRLFRGYHDNAMAFLSRIEERLGNIDGVREQCAAKPHNLGEYQDRFQTLPRPS